MERTRKQQKPERAPGSLEIVGENCESEKGEVVAKKRGRKPKKKEEVLKSVNGEREIRAEEKEIEENNGNGVSQKEGRVRNEGGISGNGVSQKEESMQNEGGISEMGEVNGDKTKEIEVDAGKKGVGRNKNKGNLTWKGGEKNKEKERLELVAGENGESIEEEKESGVSEDKRVLKGDKKVKLDEDCQLTGEEVFSVKEKDGNGVSENKKEFDETSSAKKRLRGGRKKVNYNEYEVDEEEEGILGKKKRGRRGRTVMQKREKLMAVQENGASDEEENEGVNSQMHCQQDEKNDEVKENEDLRSEEEKHSGVLEEEDGEENKVRRRGPKNQGKKLKEETSCDLGNEKEENDLHRYSRRTSTKQLQPVLKDSKKRKPNVKKFSYMVS